MESTVLTPKQEVLRISDVVRLTRLSKATVYRMMARDAFPRPFPLTGVPGGAVAWRLEDVAKWIDDRQAAVKPLPFASASENNTT